MIDVRKAGVEAAYRQLRHFPVGRTGSFFLLWACAARGQDGALFLHCRAEGSEGTDGPMEAAGPAGDIEALCARLNADATRDLAFGWEAEGSARYEVRVWGLLLWQGRSALPREELRARVAEWAGVAADDIRVVGKEA